MSKQEIDSSQISIPEKWIDFTNEELEIISNARILQIEASKWMPLLIVKLLGLKSNSIKFEHTRFFFNFVDAQKRDVFLSTQGMVDLMNRLDWVTNTTGLMLSPQIRGYKSPNYKLQNITLENYIIIDDLFHNAIQKQDDKLMNKFCRAIYKQNTPICPSFTEKQKFTIIFWYTGFKFWLKEKYPYLLSGGDEDDGDSTDQSIEDVIIPLLSALNAGQAVNNDKLRRGKMHELFYELNQNIKMNQKNNKHV